MSSEIIMLMLCSFPSLVKFLTPSSGLQGYWDPYPIDMEFRPPCMVLSTIGISKPGKLEGKSTKQCSTHLHQLHICLPSSRNKTRLLYRMSLDFAPWIKHVPFMHILWSHFAEKVSPKNSEQLHTKLLSISCHYSLHLTIVCGYLCFAYCPLYNIYNNLVWSFCRSWMRIFDSCSGSKNGWSMAQMSGTGQYHMTSLVSGIGYGETPLRGEQTGCHSITKVRVDHSSCIANSLFSILVVFLGEMKMKMKMMMARTSQWMYMHSLFRRASLHGWFTISLSFVADWIGFWRGKANGRREW